MNELEMKITEVNESIDWEYLGDLGNFITNPRSQNVWITKQLRKVHECDDGYVFDDTNNVKPSVQWVGSEMPTTAFMEYSISELQATALDTSNALGSILNSILDEAHKLLGVISTDETRMWMPKIYKFQYPHETAKYIGFGIACWGNTIDKYGNETGKWKGYRPTEFSFAGEK